jgi:1-deoxy-D-xylulose-5-phosphate reductoisomerase
VAAPTVPSPRRKRLVLLGATGSIGRSTLRVIAAHPDHLELVGIAAHGNWQQLASIAAEFRVRQVGVFDERAAREARESGAFGPETVFHGGLDGLVSLATLAEADIVLVAVVGTTGLSPALAALAAGKDLALASKEILVLAGKFVMAAARASGASLRPVDSEHAAVWQCLQDHRGTEVRRIILTASGGAFRDWPVERLAEVTPADALKHPNWSMGPKITVDSATLANKGLELIEAQWLFNLRAEQCQAVLHSQSIAHCLVEFVDGTMLAQLSPPSMTFPIQRALLHPQVVPGVESPLGLDKVFSLDFRPVDESRFPLFRLAREVMQTGGTAPAIYNAANEVAVAAFLDQKLPFLAISSVVEHTLRDGSHFEPASLSEVLAVDTESREIARRMCNKLAR